MTPAQKAAEKATEELHGISKGRNNPALGALRKRTYQVVLQAIESCLAEQDTNRKINVLDAVAQVFAGVRANIAIFKRQLEAKGKVGGHWNDGYAAAMGDAIKQLESFMEESDGKPFNKQPSAGECPFCGGMGAKLDKGKAG